MENQFVASIGVLSTLLGLRKENVFSHVALWA